MGEPSSHGNFEGETLNASGTANSESILERDYLSTVFLLKKKSIPTS